MNPQVFDYDLAEATKLMAYSDSKVQMAFFLLARLAVQILYAMYARGDDK